MALKGWFPDSVKPGIPKLGKQPDGWRRVAFGDVLSRVERPAVVHDTTEYQLVTAKRNRGGIVPRERLTGNRILTKTQFCVKTNDYLISKRQIVHGACGVVPFELDGAIVSNEYVSLLPKDDLLLDYLDCFSNSSYFQETCFHSSVGVTIEKMVFRLDDWFKYEFFLPPLPEQQAISEIISVWDRRIDLSTRLLQASEDLKKGLMLQLLTGKRRFKAFAAQEWRVLSLGQFLKPELRPICRPNIAYTAVGIRSHGKGTFLKTIDNPNSVMMDTLYRIREDDLIVNITFAWEGAIAIVGKDHEVGLVSHRFPTFTFDRSKVIPEYFRHVILTKRFVRELGLVSPGGAGRNRVMNKSDFLKIKVTIPSVDEQHKIAAILNVVSREITLLEQQLEALKLQKKGLMQKLLTGEIRVKV